MNAVEDAPRPASSAGARAARTGLLSIVVTPLAYYRLAPLVVWLVGTPPGPKADGFTELLAPAISAAILGAMGAIGVAMRDRIHAQPASPWYVRLLAFAL